MLRIVPALIGFVLIFAGCKKDGSTTESALYGIWVKGSQHGDTLQFMRKNGKNILRTNAGTTTYSENEYRFRGGKLQVKLFGSVSQDYYTLDSFTWIREGHEFNIQGIQLYVFMSSTNTYFTFVKIN